MLINSVSCRDVLDINPNKKSVSMVRSNQIYIDRVLLTCQRVHEACRVLSVPTAVVIYVCRIRSSYEYQAWFVVFMIYAIVCCASEIWSCVFLPERNSACLMYSVSSTTALMQRRG